MATLSTPRSILITAGIGGLAVVVSVPYNLAFLAFGAFLAVRQLWRGAGIGRIVPAVVMTAIVAAAHYAPLKTIEWEKARRITLPKATMSIAEMRRPEDFKLDRPFRLNCYFMVHPAEVFDDRVIHFPSRELTVAEFIRAIEGQAPLHHRFMGCGNAWSSILSGPNAAMGLGFFPAES